MALINLSPFPKIGNMINGYGLSAVFDGLDDTAGRFSASGGYAGVDFSSSPKRIDRVELLPHPNGFDASGSTTAITLTLRGRVGSAPSSATDGTVLGDVSFTDVNSQVLRTIVSSDKVTLFDYVWVTVTSGVWSIIAEMRVYDTDEPVIVAPEPSPNIVTVYQKACNVNHPLPQASAHVPGFFFDICVDEPGIALLDFEVNVHHVGNLFSPSYLGAIGIAARVEWKHATTYTDLDAAPWQWPDNSRTNGINIDDRNPAHYANVGLNTSMPIVPGYYRFGLNMTAHTDGDPRDGLARVLTERGKGLNGFRVTVIKGGAFYDMSA